MEEQGMNGQENGNGVYGPPWDSDFVDRMEAAIAQLEREGRLSDRAVDALVVGKHAKIRAYMSWRRSQASGSVAVLEPPASPTVEAIQEDLSQLESQYEGWHLELERLWELDQTAPLDEQRELRQVTLERLLTKNLQQQERLKPQLVALAAREAMTRAQGHHDDAVPTVCELLDRLALAIAQVQDVTQALEAAIDAQLDPLFGLVRPDGQPAFDIPGGRVQVQRFLVGLPDGWHLMSYLYNATAHPVTQGEFRTAMDSLPSTRPLSPVAVTTYLKGYEL